MKESEANIQKAILDYGKAMSIPMRRINVIGTPYQKNGVTYYRKSPNVGMADIHAEILISKIPVSVWIEVKSKRGKLSQAQETFRDSVASYGGFYCLVRSIEDVQEAIELVREVIKDNVRNENRVVGC